MSDPHVREIGRVTDLDGLPVIVGVDHDAVTISTAVGTARLSFQQRHELLDLLDEAGYDADVWEPPS